MDLVSHLDLTTSSPLPASPLRRRELYIDAFRGLMALVMVQGHLCDSLLSPEVQAAPWYVFQRIFHGSTAPGFLFASGFVAGLPRAPLSLRASLRRARRLLFVLGVGYALHLPWFSLWKTMNEATPHQRAILLSCDALQVIAVTQLFVILLQWLTGAKWTKVAAALALVVVAVTPAMWASDLAAGLPALVAPYLDKGMGSRFPVFPYSAFVLAGTLAGALLGRVDPTVRWRRALGGGLGLLALGTALAWILEGRVEFWGPSPAYVFIRLGGLLLLLLLVEAVSLWKVPGVQALALLGHETLLVYVLHLYLLFGGSVLVGPSPLVRLHGALGLGEAAVALVLMLPVLLAAAWLWRTAKQRAPQQAQLALLFLTIWFVWEFLTRPW